MSRPELEPLRNAATAAIRRSLEKRMQAVAPVAAPAEEDQLSEDDKAALQQHYQTLK